MRWKYPVDGDMRVRTKFTWYPWHWAGTVYWLEWVTVSEVYRTSLEDAWWDTTAILSNR